MLNQNRKRRRILKNKHKSKLKKRTRERQSDIYFNRRDKKKHKQVGFLEKKSYLCSQKYKERKMFENLSDRLERSFKILKGEGKITEINVAETMKDVRRALLDADVNYKVAKEFTNKVKEKALGMNVLTAVKPGQLMIKLVHDELEELMGGEEAPLKLESHPAVILMSGLQGSGKTTFSGKLANMLKTKKGKKPLLVACDILTCPQTR